jgi:hypothetical protein
LRESTTSYSPNNCRPTIGSVTLSGFTVTWRGLNGTLCNVGDSVTVHYIAMTLTS